MKIVVAIKRVPDSTAKIRVGPDGRSIAPDVDWAINPYDEFAIEEALRIKEKLGGEVVGISLDPDGNEAILRKALAMGVDRGVLLKGGSNFDGFAAAKALAAQLEKMRPFDLVLLGKHAIDDDSGQVPGIVAELLGIPCATVVNKMEIVEGKAHVRRQIEGAEEAYELPLPCAVAAQKGLNEPRFPSLKGIMGAKKKPIEVIDAPAVDPSIEVVALEPPPARPPGRIVGQGKEAVAELVRLLREEAKAL